MTFMWSTITQSFKYKNERVIMGYENIFDLKLNNVNV